MNSFPKWLKYFNDISDYRIYLIPLVFDDNYVYIGLIEFKTENDKSVFLKSSSKDNKNKRLSYNLNGKEIVYIEYKKTNEKTDKILQQIKNYTEK